MKTVRIDAKTLILVPIEKPTEDARKEWLLKLEENRRKYDARGYAWKLE